MIYIIAFFVPPLALLLNGQVFAAILNFIIIWPCLFMGFFFHLFWLVPSAHAIVTIYVDHDNRKHRELVNAIERHGLPPRYRP